MKTICVLCGASTGIDPAIWKAAATLAEEAARRRLTVITGGGRVGLMGMVADATLGAGGDVIGIMPRFLHDQEIAHSGLSELITVDTFHERRARMARLADGFITLPGGYGTIGGMFEQLAGRHLGFPPKPQALLNVNGFFDGLLAFLEEAVARAFLAEEERHRLLVEDDPIRLLDRLERHPAAPPRRGPGDR